MRFALLAGALAWSLVSSVAQPPTSSVDGLFVAVGYGGRRIISRDGLVWENDQRWSDEARDDDNLLCNIAFGAGRFIAVGGGSEVGHILSTRDGREWRSLQQVKGRVATIAFGNGRFVAAHDAELMFSTDGEHFQTGQHLEWKGSVHPRRSACGDTEAGFRFVIVGEIDLHAERRRVHWRGVTGDGSRWDHVALDTSGARDVAYGGGHFVVVGPDGLIESSHDGQTWQRHATASGEDFSRVVYTGTRFVISGGDRTWSSPDGLTWTKEPTRIPGNVVWAHDESGGLSFAWEGGVHFSRDLARWQKVVLPPGPSLQAVAVGQAAAPR